jgi:hypothetical protein
MGFGVLLGKSDFAKLCDYDAVVAIISDCKHVVCPHRQPPRVVQPAGLVALEAKGAYETTIPPEDQDAVVALICHQNLAVSAYRMYFCQREREICTRDTRDATIGIMFVSIFTWRQALT